MVYSAIENLNDDTDTATPNVNQQQIKPYSRASALKTISSPSSIKLISSDAIGNILSPDIISHDIAEILPGIMDIGDKNNAKHDPQKDLGDEVIEMRQQFMDQLNKANRNLLRLQHEFGKLHHMSVEFDGLVGSFKESNRHPNARDMIALQKVKDSMDLLDERVCGIASSQQDLVAMLLKMDLRIRQQYKADKLNYDSIDVMLATIDGKLAQIVEEQESTVKTEQIQRYIQSAMNAQSQQITLKVVIVFIVSMVFCCSLFPITP